MVSALWVYAGTIPPYNSTLRCCSGTRGMDFRQVDFPARPPGPMPTMDTSEERMGFFNRPTSDRAIGTSVQFHYLLNHFIVSVHGNKSFDLGSDLTNLGDL